MKKLMLSFFLLVSLGAGYHFFEENGVKYSEDRTALEEKISVRFPYKSVKWEIFTTPENRRGEVPGPSITTTLIAVFDTDYFPAPSAPVANPNYVLAESAREWLPKEFGNLLKAANKPFGNWPEGSLCKEFEAVVRKKPFGEKELMALGYEQKDIPDILRNMKNNDPREFTSKGFMCKSGKQVLLHLPVVPM